MDDLISRKDVLNALTGKDIALEYPFLNETLERIIKSLPSAQQWIPCSERLPEYGEPVLTWDGHCFFVEKRIPYIVAPDIGDHVESDWWVSDDYDGTEYYPNLRDGACIAWMPLPKPYNESEVE